MGDANASIPTPQPLRMRPMFGALGGATGATSLAFVSARSMDEGRLHRLGLAKGLRPVRGCRDLGKRDMILNDATPTMRVAPETYEVFADGVLLRAKAAKHVALARL